MEPTTTSAGAMPVAEGAMPSQSYPTGPVWAAYRLPFPGSCGARDAGVCFEGEAAGATSAAGATGAAATTSTAATTAAAPAATTTAAAPATGEAELGEAGKKAIAAERKAAKEATDRAKALEDELTALKAAGLSDSEKAIKAAEHTATAAERAKWQSAIREVRAESALRVAGATNDRLLELALRSPSIVDLKVDDSGKVIDLDKAVEQLKKDIPEMFAAAGTAGGPTRGVQTAPAGQAKTLEEAIAGYYKPKS
jgi:hypothetical protein